MDTKVQEMENVEQSPPAKKLKDEQQAEISNEKKPGETPANPLSKNQIKKQRKMEKYQEIKKERRLKERERLKQKRKEAKEQGLPRSGPSRKELKKLQKVAKTDEQALHVAVDLDYDDLMSERDVAKCVKQCLRIYTINRRSPKPLNLHLTGIKSDGNIQKCLRKNDGWENWHVTYHIGKTHTQAFTTEQLVYLTSESDNVLDKLETERVYVIGGLVDHNHHKGLCHERAIKAGLKTARLPLSEHVDMKTRAVLSTYHVFEMLLRISEGKSWTEAILQTLPLRKGAKPKNEAAATEQSSNETQLAASEQEVQN